MPVDGTLARCPAGGEKSRHEDFSAQWQIVFKVLESISIDWLLYAGGVVLLFGDFRYSGAGW